MTQASWKPRTLHVILEWFSRNRVLGIILLVVVVFLGWHFISIRFASTPSRQQTTQRDVNGNQTFGDQSPIINGNGNSSTPSEPGQKKD
jgi:hypothetical protein